MAGLMLKKRRKLSHGLGRTKCRDTQISKHGCKKSSRADLKEAIVGMPTSKRPQIHDVQYLRIPSRILKGASHEEVVNHEAWQSDVNLERMECRDTQISCIVARSLAEPLEACRPQEGLKSKAPKHPEVLGRAIRCAHHREAFIPDVKSYGGLPN
jgi:hypothetical protein